MATVSPKAYLAPKGSQNGDGKFATFARDPTMTRTGFSKERENKMRKGDSVIRNGPIGRHVSFSQNKI